MVNTAYLMPVMTGPAFFLMPLVIPLILPRYAAGVAPAQIMALGGLFMGISFAARGSSWPGACRCGPPCGPCP